MSNWRNCIKCGKPATAAITIDIDIAGLAVCGDCSEEVKHDFTLALMEESLMCWFEKKYRLNKKKRKKK